MPPVKSLALVDLFAKFSDRSDLRREHRDLGLNLGDFEFVRFVFQIVFGHAQRFLRLRLIEIAAANRGVCEYGHDFRLDLENAARHARSEVTLSAHAQSGFVIVTVADDGPGIPAERREDVMRWGRRLDQSGPGAGLGLAIVAEIAEVWGATFSIDAPEQGCRVALSIPLARGSAASSE